MLVHQRVTPSIKIASTHLYTWVERGMGRVVSSRRLQHKALARVRSRVLRADHQGTTPSDKMPCSVIVVMFYLQDKIRYVLTF